MAGTASGGARRSRLAPYLLVAPGILWLLVFFVAPVITLAQTSVAGTEGARQLRHPLLPLVPLRARGHPAGAGDGLPARVFHRVPGGQAQEPAPRAGGPAVLHHVPGPHLRLEDDPERRRARRVVAAADAPAVRGRTPARYGRRGGRRPDVQLPAVHDPA